MSRIATIEVHAHCNDLGGRIWNPAIRWRIKHAVFVVVEDDKGRRGYGECWCFDASPDALVAFLRSDVIPEFLGQDIAELEATNHRLTQKATLSARHGILASALSGVDIAIWDLRAKYVGQPLWQVLNPEGSGSANLYASGGLYGFDKDNAALAAEMLSFSDEGFHLSKMKVGGETVVRDLARVRAVIDALPKEAQIIIDGVYSYSADQAQRLYESLPEGRIVAFQSPVRAYDLAGMKQLARAGVPVMTTEAEYREEIHAYLVHEAEIAFLQTAPVACGGISKVRSLCDMTRETQTKISLEVSSTAVALMAAIQLAASDTEIAHVEYHSVHRVFFDQLRLGHQNGVTQRADVNDFPGIGIDILPGSTTIETVERFDSFGKEPREVAP